MVLAGCALTEMRKIGSSDFVRYFWGLLGILYQQKEKLQDIQLRGVYSLFGLYKLILEYCMFCIMT